MNSPRATDWIADNPLYAADLRQARDLRAQLMQSHESAEDTLMAFLSSAGFAEQKKWRLRQCAAICISTLNSPQLLSVLQALDASAHALTWKHSGKPVGPQMMPLTCSVQFAKIEVLDFLLTRLNPNERCIYGDTALVSALSCGWQDGAIKLAQVTDLRSSDAQRPYLEIASILDDAKMQNWRVSLIHNELARRTSLRESRAIHASTPTASTPLPSRSRPSI